MFRTNLFAKTFSMIVAGTIILSAAFYLFTVPLIRSLAFEMEERAANNVLDTSLLLLQQSANDLSAWRESALAGHKRDLKHVVDVGLAYIHTVQTAIRAGRLSEEQGKRQVLEHVREFKFGNNDYLWIADYGSRLISHPDPKLHGADFSQVKDVYGTLIVPPMVDAARKNGSGYHHYWWRRLGEDKPAEKLSYFVHIPEWQWIIGTGVYIDDIAKAVEERKRELIEDMRRHFRSIHIAGTGYIYIFDRNKNMIIHPNANIENTNFSTWVNPATRRPIGDELIAALDKPGKKLFYLWDKPSDPNNFVYNKISWVRHFKNDDFDWYICASVYTDDLNRGAVLLSQRILAVSFATLVLAIVGGYFLVRRFTLPIRELASAADRVSRGDLNTTVVLPREDEIGVLAAAFNNMIRQLNEQIRTLELRVAERTAELSEFVERLTRRNKEVEQINAMGEMLKVCRSREEVMVVMARTLRKLFPGARGQLLLSDADGQQLRQVFCWSDGEDCPKEALYATEDCWAMRLGRPYAVTDPLHQESCRHTQAEEAVGPTLCVPLSAHGRHIGLLHLRLKPGNEEIIDDGSASALAETVAEQAALSIANIDLQHNLHEQSIRDPLTGLYNRRHATELMYREQQRARRQNTPVGVILFDVDHFKRINDTFGHDAGDEVLRRIGTLLQKTLRAEDTPVRWGGEEFLVILPQTDLAHTVQRAEVLRQQVASTLDIQWHDKRIKVTISAGVAAFPDHGDALETVITRADQALYRAKHDGRNRVVEGGA